jgi:hypothetical protein
MRRIACLLSVIALCSSAALAQDKPAADAKKNANPCRDEVAAALQKLRNSSWFRMETSMITENGPTEMTVDYVLPDRMHQKVNVTGQPVTQEVILIGSEAWSNEGEGWRILPADITAQLMAQMKDNVLTQQDDVGNYACKGKTKFEGKDVMSYKLEDEPPENAQGTKNEAFRMFYVDALTGLPLRNAIVSPGREEKPLFKTSYSYPLDLRIEAPKDAKPMDAAPPAAAPPADAAPAAPPAGAAPDASK